ncbi:DUF3842 family protein [Sporolactobacillus shoreae]|uniref:DUF3842 family protein n=1 Tax=Sporolactobacillus shoreae TaxID=1465501 RepID=A0A4Z0GK53_9BACL|nr:DUF3842 family protein [Sporolactobacillus shoreae]TGA96442.1 DUF3842 family protein [Sporolactobacillus shoreae]
MKIAVLDGQGAGLGQSLIRKIRQELPQDLTIIALGTNTFATSKMVRAGADMGISGEKGFCSFCRRESIDGMIAPIGIIEPGSIQGEITRSMVHAFTDLSCRKYLIPLHHPKISIPCTSDIPIRDCVAMIIKEIRMQMEQNIE